MIATPNPALIQNSEFNCCREISFRCTVAVDNPRSLKRSMTAVIAVTMPISPKCSTEPTALPGQLPILSEARNRRPPLPS